MQKFSFLLALALIMGSFAFNACHDHDHDESDTSDPVLTITSPAADASLTGKVTISGKATDESLHEMTIVITKDSDNSELFRVAPSVHDETDFTISESWTPVGLTSETPVTLTVTVEDHSEHKVVKTVKFKAKS